MTVYDPWEPKSRHNQPPPQHVHIPRSTSTRIRIQRKFAEHAQQQRWQQYYQAPATGDDYYEEEWQPNAVQRGIDALHAFWWGFRPEMQRVLLIVGVVVALLIGVSLFVWLCSALPPQA